VHGEGHDLAAIARPPVDGTAGPAVLDGVPDQVGDHLRQPPAVPQTARVVVRLEDQCPVGIRHLHFGDHLGADLSEVRRLPLH